MKRILVILIALIIIGAGTSVWWSNGNSPAKPTDKTSVIFVVNQGEGIREIANRLKSQGLIKDPVIFFLSVKQMKLDKQIQAGDFRLSPSMNLSEIAKNLTHGTLDIWVTIPEGKRAEEIAEILRKEMPQFSPSWADKLILYEGHLFPDTYLLPRNASIDFIISILKNTFDKKFATIQNSTSLSKDELITIASMVEREAKFQKDRPLVASVIENRYKIGMKLDIDATIQYLLGYSQEEKNWWRKNITFEDLKISSPYNTYRNVGLPPHPIANPGLDALQAAASPTNSNYIYYISDKQGNLHFAKTLEEHNQNIKTFGL